MIRCIVALDQKRGIAKHGVQPWSIPEDEAYFARLTKTHDGHILMGAKTFDQALHGQPLNDRKNYVLTHSTEPQNGVTLVRDLKALLTEYANKDLWVIGGEQVYEQSIETGLVDELYITHIEADFECDQFFPNFDEWYVRKTSKMHEQNGFKFRYATYTQLII